MPPAAICCLLQTTRRHYRRRSIRHGSPRFPTPFYSMRTVKFSTKTWAASIFWNCGGQFWPTCPRITSASTNTGWLVPARSSRRRPAADKIVREAVELQFPFLENQSLSQVRNSQEIGSPRGYGWHFRLQLTVPSEARCTDICHCCSLWFVS